MADFDPTGGGPAAAVAAGTLGPSGLNTVTFWDPSKNAMVRDRRLVPGMTGLTAGLASPGLSAASPLLGNVTTGNPVTGFPFVQNSNGVPTQSGSNLGDAMNQLIQFGADADPTNVQTLQEQLVKGGYLDPTKKGFNLGSISGTSDPTYSAYYQLLESAIRTGTDYNAILQARVSRDAGKKYEDALSAQQAKITKQQAAAAAALLPQTINRTATNISDPLTAQNLLTQMLTQQLGRNPDGQELQSFTQALQTAQAQNPTLTTAITDPGQVQDKSSVQTGGFDPSQFTQNYVDQNFAGEKAAVGGATGFYQAALSALGPGGRGF